MTKASRKIILSVLTLVLTLVALGTTTFAWFSLSMISNVNNISGDVRAGDGLEVRMVLYEIDGENKTAIKATQWKSNLTVGDVGAFITGTQESEGIFFGKKFDAVTRSGWESGDKFTKAGATNLGNILLGEEAEANEDYIEFVIEFRSHQGGKVELTTLNIEGAKETFTPDGTPYVQYSAETGAEASLHPVLTSAAYGARVSFDEVTFQYGADDEIELGSVGEGESAVSTVVGNTVMGSTGIKAGQYDYITTSRGLAFYDDKEQSNDPIEHGQTIINAHKNTELTETDDQSVTTAKVTLELKQTNNEGYFEAETTVRIWIEGWDADSYDSIYELTLSVSMIFEKKES